MRVLFIHNHYQQFGGEDAIVDLERQTLESQGVDLILYSRHNDDIKAFRPEQKALLPLHAIHSAQTTAGIRRLIETSRPDVAYIHNIYPLISPSAYAALALAGLPSVQVAHNFRPFCLNGVLYRNGSICEECIGKSPWSGVAHRCFRGSLPLSAIYAGSHARAQRLSHALDGFICPTPFTASKLSAAGIGGDRLFIRPHFIPQDTRIPRPGVGKYALYAGRLSHEKGLNTLIDGFLRTPTVPLVIAGTGPLEEQLRRRVEASAASHIRFVGFVSGELKRQLFDSAMFVVVPSEAPEAFGMTVLEAYQAAKPVIASRVGGLPFVVRDAETGWLFEPANATELATRVLALVQNPGLCAEMGRAGRAALDCEYTPERWFERTVAIFGSVLRRQ